jgi:2-dehydropantoate 2-reductase
MSEERKMRIAVVGAGALGLYYGAMLRRSGQDVKFLLRRDYAAISAGGLHVISPAGDFHLEGVPCFRESADMGEADLVLIGLKTFDNDRMVELVRPLVGEKTAILTLQNGLGNEEILAAAFGAGQVMGGIAFLCANRGEPGTVHHLGQGTIRLGEFAGGRSDRARAVAELFNDAGVNCEAVADLAKARWEKLVWNIPFNGLSALTGLTTDRLLAHPPTRRQVTEMMAETIRAANTRGLSEPIDAPLFIGRMLEMTEPMGDYHPSMMLDRLEGRPLELEAIYGIPLRIAAEKGVKMVRVGMLHALLEAGEKR